MLGLERQLSNFRISKPLKVVDFMQLFRGHRQLREPPLSPAALSRLGEAVVGEREGVAMKREANKFVVPCIFSTHATFLLHKYKLDKGRQRKRERTSRWKRVKKRRVEGFESSAETAGVSCF